MSELQLISKKTVTAYKMKCLVLKRLEIYKILYQKEWKRLYFPWILAERIGISIFLKFFLAKITLALQF